MELKPIHLRILAKLKKARELPVSYFSGQLQRSVKTLIRYGLIEENNGIIKLTFKGYHVCWADILDELIEKILIFLKKPRYLEEIYEEMRKSFGYLGVTNYIINIVLKHLEHKGLVKTWVEFVEKKKHKKKKYVKYRYYALTDKGRKEVGFLDDIQVEIIEEPNINNEEIKKKIIEILMKAERPLHPGRIANLLQQQRINISRGYVLDLLLQMRKDRLVRKTRGGWVLR